MSEFEFLDKMFRRLNEVRSFRARDEAKIRTEHGLSKKPMPHSSYETAELMIQGSIKDYLEMRREQAK